MSRYFYQFSSKEVTALREEDTAHRLKAVAAVHQMLCQKHPQHSTAKPIPCIDWALFGFDEDVIIFVQLIFCQHFFSHSSANHRKLFIPEHAIAKKIDLLSMFLPLREKRNTN